MQKVPLDSSDVPLGLLWQARTHIQNNPEIADVSVEATNFAFTVNACNQTIYVTRPVRDRTIRPVDDCWFRVLGLTSLLHFVEMEYIDSNDLVWLNKAHRDSIRRILLSIDPTNFQTLLQELE